MDTIQFDTDYAVIYTRVHKKGDLEAAIIIKVWSLLSEPHGGVWFGWGTDTETGEEGFLVLRSK